MVTLIKQFKVLVLFVGLLALSSAQDSLDTRENDSDVVNGIIKFRQ